MPLIQPMRRPAGSGALRGALPSAGARCDRRSFSRSRTGHGAPVAPIRAGFPHNSGDPATVPKAVRGHGRWLHLVMVSVVSLAMGSLTRRPRGQAALDEDESLPGCSGDERGDDVSSMPVRAGAGPVIPHGGARIGMAGGFSHARQRHPGTGRRGDERMPQRAGAGVLGDPGRGG